MGIAAIQMAKRAGATVLATASSATASTGAPARARPRDRLPDADFVSEVRRLTEGRGADVIVDSVGGPTLQKSLSAWPTGAAASPSAMPAANPPASSTSPPCAPTTRP